MIPQNLAAWPNGTRPGKRLHSQLENHHVIAG